MGRGGGDDGGCQVFVGTGRGGGDDGTPPGCAQDERRERIRLPQDELVVDLRRNPETVSGRNSLYR